MQKKLQRGREKAPAKVAVKGTGMLQRQQFHLGVTAQEISAYDNAEGVRVEHFPVLSHLLIAQTDGHIHPPREWMVRPSPTLMAMVLVFRILACFSSLRATIESVAPVCKTAL